MLCPDKLQSGKQKPSGDHLTGYKVPRKGHFIDELPKNPIGKIIRRQLQDYC